MPNWIRNEVSFNGSEEDIKVLLDSILINKGDDSTVDSSEYKVTFNKVIPRPQSEDSNWYDWNCANWGTKWDACYCNIEDDNYNTIIFETAWATPYKFFKALSEQNPRVKIDVRYADEDFGYNVGEYTLLESNIISENIPNGGTLEAYELAINILYDDVEFFINGFIDDEIDDIISYNENNNYIKNMINIIIKNNIIPTDIDKDKRSLYDKLIFHAISEENFEYAQKVMDTVGR